MRRPTKTTNRLHFTDLSHERFEDMSLNMIYRLNNLNNIQHLGKLGKDGGVDISANENSLDGVKHWFIQCKRYSSLASAEIKKIIDKIVSSNAQLPDTLLIITACNVSRTTIEFMRKYSQECGIPVSLIWDASILEATLYKDYHEILFTYFGISIPKKRMDNAAKIRYTLKMRKRIEKDFANKEFLSDTANWHRAMREPRLKFITDEVYVRSIDGVGQPMEHGNWPAKWFKGYLHNFYDNGLEFRLDAVSGSEVIFDKDGNWEPLTNKNERQRDNPKYQVVKTMRLGRLPYHSIVEYDLESDSYTEGPYLYCHFDYEGESPFEKIYYTYLNRHEINPKKRTSFVLKEQ